MSLEEEQKLVERAKADPQEFGVVFDLYYPKIVSYVVHRVGDAAAGQDITSIVFFKAWHGLDKFEWRGLPFSAWLYRIASNEVNSYFRQKKYQPTSLDALFEETGFELPDEHDVASDRIAFEDALARHEDFVLVQALVLELPLKYQEVIALRFFEKQPVKDIAAITGKNINTVKSLLARGTAKLQRNFNKQRAL
ncbi:MAG TPA: sigma-70 family RNA polymerase sigma factor [Candidatus Saccharimonadales bacterium]|nr:sigma-70 family RNA polymerase sigma factor [Candidatus Saccharimonadales bacterium]